ncbi:hypothetical protein Z043_123853, partial [Scleropages formosus]
LVCSAIAGLLHFLFLSSFVWMFLETLQLFLLVRGLTKVQAIQKEGLKKRYLLLIGYGTPLVVVGVSARVLPSGYGSAENFPELSFRLIVFKILVQSIIFGCAWILGFFQSSTLLQYRFVIFNSQQGTFIFTIHCSFSKEVAPPT